MNKVLMAGTLMLWFVGQAAAAAQLNAPSMSCASLKQAVSSAGAAIVSFRSSRVAGPPLYERLVRNSQFCQGDEVTQTRFVPALDTPSCPLPRCVPTDCNNSNGR